MFRALVFLPLLLLVGCSTLPPKTQAIHSALTTDAALREATEQCSLTGLEVRRQAARAQLAWWSRNRTYVLGADHGLLALNWDLANTQSEDTRAVLAMQTLELIQTDSEQQLRNWLGVQASEGECSRFFERVEDGKIDLDRPKKDAETLSLFYQQRQSLADDVESSRSINTRYRKYGRSLFLVEKALSDRGCSNPEIALIRNSWPIEVYDAVCGQEDYVLVQCEWGRCEVKQ